MSDLDNLKALKILQASLKRQIEKVENGSKVINPIAVDNSIAKMIEIIKIVRNEHSYLSKIVETPSVPKARSNGSTSFYFSEDLVVFSETIQMILDAQEDILNSQPLIREDKIFITHGRNVVWQELQLYMPFRG